MDNKFQTSFIPQRPTVSATKSQGPGVNIFLLMAFVVFAVALAATAWMYYWQSSLKTKIKNQSDQLVELQKQTDKRTIDSLISINDLLATSNTLLKRHVAVSPLFQFLQANTITDIRFKSFSFSYTSQSKIGVKMSGLAKDFGTVAAQAEAFNQDQTKGISNPIFSDFSPQADGSISFNFAADLNPDLISYFILKGGLTDTGNNTQATSTPATNSANQPSNF